MKKLIILALILAAAYVLIPSITHLEIDWNTAEARLQELQEGAEYLSATFEERKVMAEDLLAQMKAEGEIVRYEWKGGTVISIEYEDGSISEIDLSEVVSGKVKEEAHGNQ